MLPISAVSIFCEDIREEKSGQDTIIGTLPDNIEVPHVPGVMPKLGLYVRIHFDIDKMPRSVSGKLVNTDGSVIPFQDWEAAAIAKTFADSKKNQAPLVGLIMKLVAGPYPIPKTGKLLAIVIINGEEFIAGALNIIAPASASSPPVSQSSSAP